MMRRHRFLAIVVTVAASLASRACGADTEARVDLSLADYHRLMALAEQTHGPSAVLSKTDVVISDDGDPAMPLRMDAVFAVDVVGRDLVDIELLSVPAGRTRLVDARGPDGPVVVRTQGSSVIATLVGAGPRELRLQFHVKRIAPRAAALEEATVAVPAGAGAASLTLDVPDDGTRVLMTPPTLGAVRSNRTGTRRWQGPVPTATVVRAVWARPGVLDADHGAVSIAVMARGPARADYCFEVGGIGERMVALRLPTGVELEGPASSAPTNPDRAVVDVGSSSADVGRYQDFLVVNLTPEQRFVRVPVTMSGSCVTSDGPGAFSAIVPLVRSGATPLAVSVRADDGWRVVAPFTAVTEGSFEPLVTASPAARLFERLHATLDGRRPPLTGCIPAAGTSLALRVRQDGPVLPPLGATVDAVSIECFVAGDGSPPLTHLRYVIDNRTKSTFELNDLRDPRRVVAVYSNGHRVALVPATVGSGKWAVPLTFFGPGQVSSRGIVDLYLLGDEGSETRFEVPDIRRLPVSSSSAIPSGLSGLVPGFDLGGPGGSASPMGDDFTGDGRQPNSPLGGIPTGGYHKSFLVDVYSLDGSIATLTPSVDCTCQREPEVADGAKLEGPLPVPAAGKPVRWRVELPFQQGPSTVLAMTVSLSRPSDRRNRDFLLFVGVLALIGGCFVPRDEYRLGAFAVGGLLLLLGLLVAPPLDGSAVGSMAAALVVAALAGLSLRALEPDADDEPAA